MANAQCTTTSAPPSTVAMASASRTSAGRTVLSRQPRSAGSRTRRAVATTCPTRASSSSRRTSSRPTVPVAPVTATVSGSLMAFQGVADEPEHRRPEPDEQRAALRVAACLLVDDLRADPQRQAQPDAAQRRAVKGPRRQADALEGLDEHLRAVCPVARFLELAAQREAPPR